MDDVMEWMKEMVFQVRFKFRLQVAFPLRKDWSKFQEEE